MDVMMNSPIGVKILLAWFIVNVINAIYMFLRNEARDRYEAARELELSRERESFRLSQSCKDCADHHSDA